MIACFHKKKTIFYNALQSDEIVHIWGTFTAMTEMS